MQAWPDESPNAGTGKASVHASAACSYRKSSFFYMQLVVGYNAMAGTAACRSVVAGAPTVW